MLSDLMGVIRLAGSAARGPLIQITRPLLDARHLSVGWVDTSHDRLPFQKPHAIWVDNNGLSCCAFQTTLLDSIISIFRGVELKQ